MSGARKDDKNKPDISLIPYCAQVAEAEAFMVGLKYSRYNYCDGMEASRQMAALLRHALKWFNGEERDPDGQHHLGSVKACASMILRQMELGTLIDDRYKPQSKVQPHDLTSEEKEELAALLKEEILKVEVLNASTASSPDLGSRTFDRSDWTQITSGIRVNTVDLEKAETVSACGTFQGTGGNDV